MPIEGRDSPRGAHKGAQLSQRWLPILAQVFLDGEAALVEEERKEERAAREFRHFNHRHPLPPIHPEPLPALACRRQLTGQPLN
jgi:hypothetical protein